MANPRKFSEKIALHNQKQAEETAAFEKIMQDTQCVTRFTVSIFSLIVVYCCRHVISSVSTQARQIIVMYT